MKKVFLIGIPFVVILIVAGFAFTQSDNDDRPGHRRFEDRDWMMMRGGMHLGVVLNDERNEKGARVEEVLPDSPAAKAGIKEGDIITRLNGKEVEDARDVRELLNDMNEPKKVDLEISRDGKQMTLSATPEKRQDVTRMLHGFGGRYLGVDLQDLDSDLASYFKIDPKAGVLITRVEPESPAQKAGLRSGDIVTQLNGKRIASQEDLRDALNDLKEGEDAKLLVLRHGKQEQILAHPEERGFRGGFRELERLSNNPEMSQLREQLRDLPERPEVQRSMEELRRQMHDLRNQIDRELKPQIEEMKKQLQKLRKAD
jgi:Trypsin-like serine proteases, typically periplasmic, contain C-terminal PDZ domain